MRANLRLVRCQNCKQEFGCTEKEQAVWCTTCNHYVSKYWNFKGNKHLTEEQREQIRKQFTEKYVSSSDFLSIADIAKQYGVSDVTIRNTLKDTPTFQKYLKEYREEW